MKTKIIFFIQLSLLVFNLEAAPSVPRAVNGVIDLSNYNFETREAVKLSGDWRFFWKKFINPSLSDKEKIFNEGENIQVPGTKLNFFMTPMNTSFTKDANEIKVLPNRNFIFTSSRVISGRQNKTDNHASGVESFDLRCEFESTDSGLSPIIDMNRLSLFAIQNRINNFFLVILIEVLFRSK